MDPRLHQLPATPETVHWGFFDHAQPPVLTVEPGDLVAVETVTHQAGDAPDLMMDDGIRRIFDEVTDRGPGPHLLTGPIHVTGAEPGDVLVVEILALRPRLPWGANLTASWGHLYDEVGKERVTVFALDEASATARAAFAFDWDATPSYAGANGVIVAPDPARREPALPKVVVPMRPHLGTMGVAPSEPGRHSSVPPGLHGGNIDNWRIGAGGTMHYPVQVPGALLSLGDPHVSQGDGEVSGTALESSLTGLIRISLDRDSVFDVPTLETATHQLVHGFGDTLDEAMAMASRRMLGLLQRAWGLSRDDAYSLMSVAVDFTITQVVDTRVGVHACVEKRMFG